jgi:hypothetical protein
VRFKRRLRAIVTVPLRAARDVVRLVGWLYVVVFLSALLVVSYLAIRQMMNGGDVVEALRMLPLALIWPLAALFRHGDRVGALDFPANVIVLVVCVAFIITGWTVLILAVRDLVRWRGAR